MKNVATANDMLVEPRVRSETRDLVANIQALSALMIRLHRVHPASCDSCPIVHCAVSYWAPGQKARYSNGRKPCNIT